MSEKLSAREWFSIAGERIMYTGKLGAAFVATATALYPLAATYFKVEAMQVQLAEIMRKLDKMDSTK